MIRSPGLKTFFMGFSGAEGFDVPAERLNPTPRIESSDEELDSAQDNYGVELDFLFGAFLLKMVEEDHGPGTWLYYGEMDFWRHATH